MSDVGQNYSLKIGGCVLKLSPVKLWTFFRCIIYFVTIAITVGCIADLQFVNSIIKILESRIVIKN